MKYTQLSTFKLNLMMKKKSLIKQCGNVISMTDDITTYTNKTIIVLLNNWNFDSSEEFSIEKRLHWFINDLR